MQITVNNARLSYPKLFRAEAGPSGGDPKFGCTLLLEKEKDLAEVDKVKDAIRAVMKEKWGDEIPKGVKVCLRNGAEKEDSDGYGEGVMFFNASNAHRIPVVGRDRRPLAEEDGVIYAGCYVNAVVRFWPQDNKFGKRVNCQLKAVQFAQDGEPFVADKPVKADEVFENLEQGKSSGVAGDGPMEDDDIPF